MIKVPKVEDRKTDKALRSMVKQIEAELAKKQSTTTTVSGGGGGSGGGTTGGDSFLEWAGL